MFSNPLTNFSKNFPKFLFWIIVFSLVVIPFFWFKPGEMDLGGDSSRLYFYDPISFLKNASLYSVSPEGKGLVEPAHFYLPFVGLLALSKFFLRSPYLLITFLNIIKLEVGFLAIYLILKEIFSFRKNSDQGFFVEICSILAGIFYILTPTMTGNWDKALLPHNQVFLNPLMFYLLFRYFLSQQKKYLYFFLLISFIFAPNFALTSAPAFFSFYPLSIAFLLMTIRAVRRKPLPRQRILTGFLLFLGLQSFHLIPQVVSLFDPSSFANTRVFGQESAALAVRYFIVNLKLASVSKNILLPSSIKSFGLGLVLVPLVVIAGLILNKKKNQEFLLTGIFFLITLFLLSAKITNLGVEFYKRLFYLPGFSMFRNFVGQWLFVFSFFYALLFGQALMIIFGEIKNKKLIIFLTILMTSALVISSWSFIDGRLVNKVLWQSKGVRMAIKMDPRYEETLNFIRSLPDDGKILTLPLTDAYQQVIYGLNEAAYIGPSTIAYLGGKKDFCGYQILAPFSEDIMRFFQEKNYQALTQVFSLLNIRYIFHNADPKIYEEKFPGFPYRYMRAALPKDQSGYQEFIKNLPVKLIYKNHPFYLYKLIKEFYRPEIYVAGKFYLKEEFPWQEADYQSVYLDRQLCHGESYLAGWCHRQEDVSPKVDLKVKKLNPTAYFISVEHREDKPYLLVFQNAFHQNWQLEVLKGKKINQKQHLKVNDYANAWIIRPSDIDGQKEYTLKLTLVNQDYFRFGLIISGATLAFLILLGKIF